jgi:integrase
MPRKTSPKLSEALEQYMKIRATHVAPSTLANDQSVLRKFVREVGDPAVHLLEPAVVEAWFAEVAVWQQPSSFNKIRTRVNNFTAFCTRRGWLTSDPMGEVRPRKVVKRERLHLSTQEMQDLIEKTDNPRDRGMLALACNTGLRSSDITALTIGNVDLDQGLLSVSVQKTGEFDRLPITSDLDTELRRWLGWYAERMAWIGEKLEPDYLLFPAMGHRNVRRNGKVQWWGDPQPFQKLTHPAQVVQRALQRIDVYSTAHEGFHTLRRSLGTAFFKHAADRGHDSALRLTAAMLGHKNTATTEIYLSLSHDRVQRDELLKGKSLFATEPKDNVIPLRRLK